MNNPTNIASNKKKTTTFIPNIAIDLIDISRFNPRKHKSEDHIDALAESIKEHDFDSTFALKCHKEQWRWRYLVVAWGNRLEACKKLQLPSVPVFLYEGYSEGELRKMGYSDNEKSEKQKKLHFIDKWLDYSSKKEEWLKQSEIAEYLGVGEAIVSYRVQLAWFPQSVLDKIYSQGDKIKELYCRELLKLRLHSVKNYWFDHEEFLTEIIENILNRTTTPNLKHFEREVAKYNEAIWEVQEWIDLIDDEKYRQLFVQDITEKKARAKAVIANQGAIRLEALKADREGELQLKLDELTEMEEEVKQTQKEEGIIADEEAIQLDVVDTHTQEELQLKWDELAEIEEKVHKIEEVSKKQAKIQVVTDNVLHGDARELLHDAPDDFKLLLIDPPYGMNLDPSRRKSAPKKKIANDESLEGSVALLEEVLSIAYEKMDQNATIFVWCRWKCEKEFMEVITDVGFCIKSRIIWKKGNAWSGDCAYSFAPQHEGLIHATKGKVQLSQRPSDVLEGCHFLETDHPTPKPIDLLTRVIEATTLEHEMVVDCFLWCWSTGVAALSARRKFWGCEIDKEYRIEALNHVHKVVEERV